MVLKDGPLTRYGRSPIDTTRHGTVSDKVLGDSEDLASSQPA